MRRYWLPPESFLDQEIKIEGEAFHHIHEVCRQGIGHRFEVLKGDGKAYLCEIKQVTKREARAAIIESRMIEPLPKPYIHLALSIPKLPKVDFVIEKCVELGVHSLHPFVSEFSFIRQVKEISLNRQERWKKIVQAATEQCGRGELMQLTPATSLEKVWETMNQTDSSVGLFCYEGEGGLPLRQALARAKTRSPQNVWVFVGSEGGFSVSEVNLFKQRQMEPITLGSQVLRVETACVALASVIKYDLDLMR